MTRALFDSRFLANLGDFFPLTVTIQEATSTQDSYGAAAKSWANKAGHVGIPCASQDPKGEEVKRPDMTYAVAGMKLILQGYYSGITTTMRAVCGGVTYDILAVQHDSQHVATTLLCEVVT